MSVNLLQEAVGIEGKAVLIELSIQAPRESADDGSDNESKTITLAKPGAFWGELVTIEIRDSDGTKVPGLKVRLVSKGDATATLDAKKSGWLVWVLDPSDAGRLPAGEYTFQAILDCSKAAGEGWKGKVWSTHADLAVKPVAETLSEVEQRSVLLVEVRVLSALERYADALDACVRFLETHPRDRIMLEEKGDLLFQLKKPQQALDAYDAALAIEQEFEENAIKEPPTILLQKRKQASSALAP